MKAEELPISEVLKLANQMIAVKETAIPKILNEIEHLGESLEKHRKLSEEAYDNHNQKLCDDEWGKYVTENNYQFALKVAVSILREVE